MKFDDATKRLLAMETVWRYAEAADAGDYMKLSRTFTPSGQLIVSGRVLSGRKQIHETLHGMYLKRNGDSDGNFQRHHVTTSNVTFTNDTSANGIIYVLVVTERGPDHSARYLDKYRFSDGEVLISERTIMLDWITSNSRFSGFAEGR